MIFFIAGGRLGNQLFQYSFIQTLRKSNEKVIVAGFDELLRYFEIKDIVNLSLRKRYIKSIFYRLIMPISNFIASKKIVNFIYVNKEKIDSFEREDNTYSEERGFFSSIRFIKLGYFQSESLFDPKVAEFQIKKRFILEAELFLKDIPANSYKIFVHIRRGDYKDFTIFGKSTMLPLNYYKKCILYFQEKYLSPFFIILSDEPNEAEKEFSYLHNKIISLSNNPGVDFAIITKCNSGVLSTSTFGWWAAYLIKEKNEILAPQYWLGFSYKVEFPKGGFPRYAVPIEIP